MWLILTGSKRRNRCIVVDTRLKNRVFPESAIHQTRLVNLVKGVRFCGFLSSFLNVEAQIIQRKRTPLTKLTSLLLLRVHFVRMDYLRFHVVPAKANLSTILQFRHQVKHKNKSKHCWSTWSTHLTDLRQSAPSATLKHSNSNNTT